MLVQLDEHNDRFIIVVGAVLARRWECPYLPEEDGEANQEWRRVKSAWNKRNIGRNKRRKMEKNEKGEEWKSKR